MVYNYLLLILGLGTLIAAGEILVRGAVGISLKLKIPTIVVGLTVVSFGTSAPELIISLQAVLDGNPDVAIGNIVGSNIANIALVLGLTAIILPLPFDRSTLRKDWPIMMCASIIFLIFILDRTITFYEGMAMFAGLIIYIFYMIKRARSGRVSISVVDEVADMKTAATKPYILLLGYVVLASVGLHFGAEWFLEGALFVAKDFGLSDRVIGVTIVAFGTSTPELAASVIAAVKKEMDISIGNLIGSNIFNILCVLGITSMIAPLPVADQTINFDIYWMLGIAAILLPMMLLRKDISRLNGGILLSLYIAYIILVL